MKQPIPAAGQPGGAGDPLRQGLSGAGRKWYLRYLERGLMPEEARQRALEHRAPNASPAERVGNQAVPGSNVSQVERVGGQAVAGWKRQLHHTSQPDLPKTESKKTKRTSQVAKRPKAASYANVAKGINMAILAWDYPRRLLTKDELTAVEQALVEEMRKGWTAALNFKGIQFRDGLVLVDCMDDDAKKWLELTVPSISNTVGVQLRTCLQEDFALTNIVTVYLPRTAGETMEKSLQLLNEQNKGLLTETWRAIRHLESKGGKVLTFGLDEESLTLLKKRDMLVSYRFGQLKCRLHKKQGPAEAGVSTEASTVDVPCTSAAAAKVPPAYPSDEAAEAEALAAVEAELASLHGLNQTRQHMCGEEELNSNEEPSDDEQTPTGTQTEAYLMLSEGEEEY